MGKNYLLFLTLVAVCIGCHRSEPSGPKGAQKMDAFFNDMFSVSDGSGAGTARDEQRKLIEQQKRQQQQRLQSYGDNQYFKNK